MFNATNLLSGYIIAMWHCCSTGSAVKPVIVGDGMHGNPHLDHIVAHSFELAIVIQLET